MSVKDLSEADILNYLMTSEFNEGLTPDEFKFLLHKFRYNYRILFAKRDSFKSQAEKLHSEILFEKEIYNKNLERLTYEKQELEKRYNQIVSRKLSWKERFKGKIIIKEDEINGI